MEIEKTVTPLPGVTLDPQSGTAKVLDASGHEVKTEVKKDGTLHLLFQNTPAAHKLAEELIRLNGLEAEAAAARGQVYKPTLGARIKSVATSNVTPLKLVAFAVIGGVSIWLGRMALRKMAEYFGWNLFGNEIGEEDGEMSAGGNRDFDERRSPRRQRRTPPNEPTQPTASA